MSLLSNEFSNALSQLLIGLECDTKNQSVTAVAPGSWEYVRCGQPNEESDYESSWRNPLRHHRAIELCEMRKIFKFDDLYYIFTFYYICAVVRAVRHVCVLQEVLM
jgi:hypothetical protein